MLLCVQNKDVNTSQTHHLGAKVTSVHRGVYLNNKVPTLGGSGTFRHKIVSLIPFFGIFSPQNGEVPSPLLKAVLLTS